MKELEEVKMLEALSPPEDYELDWLVGTTYSLDPSVYLSIVSAASFNVTESSGALEFGALNKEEWRRVLLEKIKRCILICDHHGALHTKSSSLNALEKLGLDWIVKNAGRDSHGAGSMHSKLILALYKNSTGNYLGRLYVGSKNFTLAHYPEFGAVYELKQTSSKRGTKFSNSLVEFLKYLGDEELTGSRQEKFLPIKNAISILQKYSLSPVDPDIEFFWQGRFANSKEKSNGKTLIESIAPLLKQGWDSGFVRSPWTRKSAVVELKKYLGEDKKLRIFCLKEPRLTTVKDKNVLYEFTNSATGVLQSYQSHSKVYYFTRKNEALLIFGSANFTADGLGVSAHGCKNNAEILVAQSVSSLDYRYLTDIRGRSEESEQSGTVAGDTVSDKVLKFLNSIQVKVRYEFSTGVLEYSIDKGVPPKELKSKICIAHELLQTPKDFEGNELIVANCKELNSQYEINWPKSNLFCISSLIRISCLEYGLHTHLVVDLDSEFYEGRENLQFLRFKSDEIVSSLARLMDISIPEEAETKTTNGPGIERRIRSFLEGLRVERYAYKLARLRIQEPVVAKNTIRRVERLIEEVSKSDELKNYSYLLDACLAIKGVHEIIS